MFSAIEVVMATFLGLLPISNPFSTVPLFLSLTRGQPDEWARQQALKACFYMIGILFVFLWAGALIIEFFGISIPAIRIAGGVIIMRVGFAMLNPQTAKPITDEEKREAAQKDEIAFTPLAMPSLSGPGSIAVVIGTAAGFDNLLGYISISVGVLMVAFVGWLAMRGAPLIARVLGVTGLDAITRIMGFLLITIAFQFVFDGIAGFFADELFLGPIIDNLQPMLAEQ